MGVGGGRGVKRVDRGLQCVQHGKMNEFMYVYECVCMYVCAHSVK